MQLRGWEITCHQCHKPIAKGDITHPFTCPKGEKTRRHNNVLKVLTQTARLTKVPIYEDMRFPKVGSPGKHPDLTLHDPNSDAYCYDLIIGDPYRPILSRPNPNLLPFPKPQIVQSSQSPNVSVAEVNLLSSSSDLSTRTSSSAVSSLSKSLYPVHMFRIQKTREYTREPLSYDAYVESSRSDEPVYSRALKPIILRHDFGSVNFIPLAISVGGTHSPELKNFLKLCGSRAVECKSALGNDGYAGLISTTKRLISVNLMHSIARGVSIFRSNLYGFHAHLDQPGSAEWPNIEIRIEEGGREVDTEEDTLIE